MGRALLNVELSRKKPGSPLKTSDSTIVRSGYSVAMTSGACSARRFWPAAPADPCPPNVSPDFRFLPRSELIARAEAIGSAQRVVLDMDSTEIPVYGEPEQSAYNGHFESTCYHPLLLFNREGDCLAAKLRPGNVHSAEDWEELLLPEIERNSGRAMS